VRAFPRCGDGQLALAVARQGMLVHAMSEDPAAVDALARAADAEGLLGRQI